MIVNDKNPLIYVAPQSAVMLNHPGWIAHNLTQATHTNNSMTTIHIPTQSVYPIFTNPISPPQMKELAQTQERRQKNWTSRSFNHH